MPADDIIGWDIGGAHLKAARIGRNARIETVVQLPCPLWQGLDQLRKAFDDALSRIGDTRRHAITMTGELVDLFASREQGVAAIADTAAECLHGGSIYIFAGRMGFLPIPEACKQHHAVASANWMATATLVGRHVSDALLVDIGSTTTDLVSVTGGTVAARGDDDATRLAADELLYFGVVRTPLMALAQRWPFDGSTTAICNEYFATIADIYRITGDLPEGVDQYPSADNGPKTVAASIRRLARMVGRDADAATNAEWHALARWLKQTHLDITERAIRSVHARSGLESSAPIVSAGAGSFLVGEIAARLGRRHIDFATLVGGDDPATISTCAPAVAVALLAYNRREVVPCGW